MLERFSFHVSSSNDIGEYGGDRSEIAKHFFTHYVQLMHRTNDDLQSAEILWHQSGFGGCFRAATAAYQCLESRPDFEEYLAQHGLYLDEIKAEENATIATENLAESSPPHVMAL